MNDSDRIKELQQRTTDNILNRALHFLQIFCRKVRILESVKANANIVHADAPLRWASL
jgi:hypothetical protein